jgi:hypothetical protein
VQDEAIIGRRQIQTRTGRIEAADDPTLAQRGFEHLHRMANGDTTVGLPEFLHKHPLEERHQLSQSSATLLFWLDQGGPRHGLEVRGTASTHRDGLGGTRVVVTKS